MLGIVAGLFWILLFPIKLRFAPHVCACTHWRTYLYNYCFVK